MFWRHRVLSNVLQPQRVGRLIFYGLLPAVLGILVVAFVCDVARWGYYRKTVVHIGSALDLLGDVQCALQGIGSLLFLAIVTIEALLVVVLIVAAAARRQLPISVDPRILQNNQFRVGGLGGIVVMLLVSIFHLASVAMVFFNDELCASSSLPLLRQCFLMASGLGLHALSIFFVYGLTSWALMPALLRHHR